MATRQFSNERSFAVLLENENSLVFKMHAARANIVWYAGDAVQEIFRNNFQNDLTIAQKGLDRDIDWSFEEFERHQDTLPQTYFTFGTTVWHYLEENGFINLSLADKWKLFKKTLSLLETPHYYICQGSRGVSLSLMPGSNTIKTFSDPIEAINEFFVLKTSTLAMQNEKLSLLSQVHKKLKQATTYVDKSREKLKELEGDRPYQQWADLLMANLHMITQGTEKVELENFYDNQRCIEIKLKKDLSPQKNAEVYYRKGKNQVIEIRTLKESIELKEEQVRKLAALQFAIEEAEELTAVRNLAGKVLSQAPDPILKKSLPYHEFEFKGFRIWVGRNAKANDTLTLKHAYKEDLWLHAKDVAGSHVLIKHQPGKPFPKDVIERAASMAAYYSKRKNETLCPVSYTPKKFVRKRKGDPAGAVMVEREDVIMVTPDHG